MVCALSALHLSTITSNNIGMIILSRQNLSVLSLRDNDRSGTSPLLFAQKTFEEVQQLYPSSWRWKLNLACLLIARNDLTTAIDILKDIPASSADCFQARSLLGQIYAARGEWRQAAEMWKVIGAVGPLYRLASKYRDHGEKEIALELFQAATEANPGLPESWEDLGWLRYEVNKDKVGAVAALQQAILLQPSRSYTYCLLCRVYYESGDYDQVSTLASQINTLFPSEACGWDYQARVLRNLGRGGEAELTLKRGIDQLPKDASLQDRLADLYYYQKRFPEAIKEWTIAVQLSPGTWWYYSHLGEGYMGSGDRVHALENFRQALALEPDDARLQELVTQLEKELEP